MKKIIIGITALGLILFGVYFWSAKIYQPQEEPAFYFLDVVYTDSGFNPKSLTIPTGTVINFRNESSQAMWVASAKHPTHAVYPTTGGCIGSTFDACRAIQPGDFWPFKFDIEGIWKYHNHLKPTDFGEIHVFGPPCALPDGSPC